MKPRLAATSRSIPLVPAVRSARMAVVLSIAPSAGLPAMRTLWLAADGQAGEQFNFEISTLKCRRNPPIAELSENGARRPQTAGRKNGWTPLKMVHLTAGMPCKTKPPQGVTHGRSQLWSLTQTYQHKQALQLLGQSSAMLSQSLARLSSGSKITSPADDSAGLAVSMNLTAQMGRNTAAQNNVNNAISFNQTQDGYLQQVDNALNRMSELACSPGRDQDEQRPRVVSTGVQHPGHLRQ